MSYVLKRRVECRIVELVSESKDLKLFVKDLLEVTKLIFFVLKRTNVLLKDLYSNQNYPMSM